MATLSQYYKHKDKNGTGTTVKKAFMVPYDELYLSRAITSALLMKSTLGKCANYGNQELTSWHYPSR